MLEATRTFDGIRAALAAIHQPDSSNEARRTALKFCDEFRQLGVEGLDVVLRLCALDQPDPVRHFGLQTLSSIVEKSWNNLGPQLRLKLKQTSLEFVQNGSRGVFEEQNFAKEMIARVVVEIAKREWPQQWPDLHERILASVKASEAARQLSIIVFSCLAELVVKPTMSGRVFLPERRRLEIRQGLETCLPVVFALVTETLDMYIARFRSSPGGSLEQRTNRSMIDSCLQCIISFAQWVSHSGLVDGRIVAGLSSLLGISDFFEESCEALSRICSRKEPARSGVAVCAESFQAEMQAAWAATISVCNAILHSPSFKGKSRLLKLAVDLLSALTKHHLPRLGDAPVPLRHSYLTILGDLLKQDDFDVGFQVLSLWTPLLRGSRSVDPVGVPNGKPGISVAAACSVMPQSDSPDRGPLLAELLSIAEFRYVSCKPEDTLGKDGADELTRQFNRYRTSLLDLVKALTDEAPGACLESTGKRAVALLSTVPADSLNEAGFATFRSTNVLELQAVITLLSHICDVSTVRVVLSGTGPDPGGVLSSAEAILITLINTVVEDPLMAGRQCTGLVLFHELFAHRHDALSAVVEKLLALNDFQPSRGQDIDQVCADVLNTQRRALYALVSMAKRPHISSVMLQWFSQLSPALLALSKSRPKHSAMLIEVLVAIANSLPSSDERIGFVRDVVQSSIVEWTSPELSAIIQPQKFFTVLGLYNPPSDSLLHFDLALATAGRDMRRQLGALLNAFLSVFRSVVIPSDQASVNARQYLWSLLSSVLPNVFMLLRNMHSLLSLSCQSKAIGAARTLIDPFSPDGTAVLNAELSNPEHRKMVDSIRNHTQSLRDRLYLLIGLALDNENFFSSVDSPTIADLALNVLPDLHWSRAHILISKFWLPFVTLCPLDRWDILLGPLFSRLISIGRTRLSEGWSAILDERDPALDPVSSSGSIASSVGREVFDENCLREFTRTYLSLISSALVHQQWIPFSDHQHTALRQTGVRQEELCRMVVSDFATINELLEMLRFAVVLPDSIAQSKALILCSRLLPLAVENPHFHQMFMDIVTICLRELSGMDLSKALSSSSAELINLSHEIILTLMPLSDAPRQLLLSIPGVVPEEVGQLLTVLRTGVYNGERKTRMATRAFVGAYVVGASQDFGAVSQSAAGTPAVLDLPPLVLPPKVQLQSSGGRSPSPPRLHELFQT